MCKRKPNCLYTSSPRQIFICALCLWENKKSADADKREEKFPLEQSGKFREERKRRKSISYWIYWYWIVIGERLRSFWYAIWYGFVKKPRWWNWMELWWMFGEMKIKWREMKIDAQNVSIHAFAINLNGRIAMIWCVWIWEMVRKYGRWFLNDKVFY